LGFIEKIMTRSDKLQAGINSIFVSIMEDDAKFLESFEEVFIKFLADSDRLFKNDRKCIQASKNIEKSETIYRMMNGDSSLINEWFKKNNITYHIGQGLQENSISLTFDILVI